MTRVDFLQRVQARGGLASPKEAERWSAAALRGLTQLMPNPELRRHFISQLPGFLKSRLRDEPPPALVMDRDAFVQHVAATLGTHAAEGERVVRAVWSVLKEALSPGQIAEFETHAAKDIVAFLERGA